MKRPKFKAEVYVQESYDRDTGDRWLTVDDDMVEATEADVGHNEAGKFVAVYKLSHIERVEKKPVELKRTKLK